MNRYQKVKGGFLDTTTNIVWKEFPENGLFTYEEALKLQKNGWRLPTIKELVGVVDYGKSDPATSLPNQLKSSVWSCLPLASTTNSAWVLSFYYGFAVSSSRNNLQQVRLIRDTESIY